MVYLNIIIDVTLVCANIHHIMSLKYCQKTVNGCTIILVLLVNIEEFSYEAKKLSKANLIKDFDWLAFLKIFKKNKRRTKNIFPVQDL